MNVVDVSKFTRKADLSGTLLKTKGNRMYVTEDCFILVPERYVNTNMLIIDDSVSIVSIFPLVDSKGNYTVANMSSRVTIHPYTINDVMVKEIPYKKLLFKKGDIFMEDIRIIRNADVTNNIFDEFFLKGNVPWFLEYQDLNLVYSLSKDYSDSKIGNNTIVMELLTSVIARNKDDKLQYFRTVKNKKSNTKPTFVPMQSVFYSFSNTTNKLVGSYMSKGIVSALVNPADETENIERILRS